MQTDIQNPELYDNDKQPEPWQLLTDVVRKWAIMSQHEKEQENYRNLQQSETNFS
jgi:hypothetical protein